jgi:chemotaxis protein MotB
VGKKKKKSDGGGAPGWIVTFADLATLLMSFFVLLLAFSEMDIVKYKAVSGSMKDALGVQADSTEITLSDGDPSEIAKLGGSPDESDQMGKGTAADAQLIKDNLAEEIEEKKITLDEGNPGKLLIRLPEKGVFPSGSDELARSYVPVLKKVRDTLASVDGSIYVAGHTDDLKIKNKRFRSNWDLSAARAVSVVHVLLQDGKISSDRIVAQGYAESRPLVANVDRASRATNRRVDIILVAAKGKSVPSEEGESADEQLEGTDGQGDEPSSESGE